MYDDGVSEVLNESGVISEGYINYILSQPEIDRAPVDSDVLQSFQSHINLGLFQKLAMMGVRRAHDRLKTVERAVYYEHIPDDPDRYESLSEAVFDENIERHTTLSDAQIATIRELMKSLRMMIIRVSEGFERREINTNIAHTDGDETV